MEREWVQKYEVERDGAEGYGSVRKGMKLSYTTHLPRRYTMFGY